MICALERARNCMADTSILLAMHWKETEGYRRNDGYCPDYEQGLRLEDIGNFLYFTARNEDGVLLGHIGFIIHKSRHTSKIEAHEDFFYFKPESRKGTNALKLLRFSVNFLKEKGISNIGMSSKLPNDIDVLLRRVGFKKVAHFYMLDK